MKRYTVVVDGKLYAANLHSSDLASSLFNLVTAYVDFGSIHVERVQ